MKPANLRFCLLLAALGAAGFAAGYIRPDKTAPPVAKPSSFHSRANDVLRSGDPETIAKAMADLAMEDPVACLKGFSRFPAINGRAEALKEAAARLASLDPKIAAEALNSISDWRLRGEAWHEYLKHLEHLPFRKRIEIAMLAEPRADILVSQAVIQPALKKDLEGTLSELSATGDIPGYYSSALYYASQANPEVAIRRMREAIASGEFPPSTATDMVENLCRSGKIADLAEWMKDASWPQGLAVKEWMAGGFSAVGPEEKVKMIDVITTLPDIRKNAILSHLSLDDSDADQAARIVNAINSVELQEKVLTSWLSEDRSSEEIARMSETLTSGRTLSLLQYLSTANR